MAKDDDLGEKKCDAMAVSSCPWPAAMEHHHAVAYFGLSCALAVLRRCDLGVERRPCRWSRRREAALMERIGEVEREADELRRRRAEDARANEKVAGIFAAHEQRWFAERRALRRQVHAVVAAARAREEAHDAAVAEMAARLEEEQRQRGVEREEAEEKIRAAAEKEAELEAEAARAARRGEAAEAEAGEAVARRDEMAAEAARLRRDAEHKDKILSAMLRKSKIDMDDREMLVREVKMCKARRKQAELEAERWRKMWESRHRRSSRSSAAAPMPEHSAGCSDAVACAHDAKILFVDHVEEADAKKCRHTAALPPPVKNPAAVECVDDKPVVEEYQDLQEWFKMETEKYTSMIRQRHAAEVEAFTEQLRLKDEKLEAFRWRAASVDAEASRLRSRIQELESRLSELEQRRSELEQRGAALESLLAAFQPQARVLDDDKDDAEIFPTGGGGGQENPIPWSPSPEAVEAASARVAEIRLLEPVSPPDEHRNTVFDMGPTLAHDVVATSVQNERELVVEHETPRQIVPARNSYTCEIEEEDEVFTDRAGNARSRDSSTDRNSLALVVAAPPPPPEQQRSSASNSKMDIQALAVSYKIKRLKQQLLVLENLAAAASSSAAADKNDTTTTTAAAAKPQYPRSYQTMVSFVSKHVKRYQSLEDKIDDLCTRMEESKRGRGRESGEGGSREQSAALARFLEETFQLQRYMVATGQKLLEMQSRIAPSLSRGNNGGEDDGVDMGRFMEVVGALLRDVQRGLEVRIARIIGDLEGTLTFHGILHTTF
uniref:Uncharacterized protein n=1 Tax=Leersia perrieri TaxID=77586 RepID=A0A0D9V1X6_9ORYZ